MVILSFLPVLLVSQSLLIKKASPQYNAATMLISGRLATLGFCEIQSIVSRPISSVLGPSDQRTFIHRPFDKFQKKNFSPDNAILLATISWRLVTRPWLSCEQFSHLSCCSVASCLLLWHMPYLQLFCSMARCILNLKNDDFTKSILFSSCMLFILSKSLCI